jgi:hypothetical protein
LESHANPAHCAAIAMSLFSTRVKGGSIPSPNMQSHG